MFDPDWKAHGHLDRAVAMIEQWSRARAIEGLRVEVVRLGGRTPLIFMEVPGRGDDPVLLYGHCDKQPEMVGWGEGLGPWTPVRRGDKLYGRGAADDGYAAFAALTSIQALQAQGVPHARRVVLIQARAVSGVLCKRIPQLPFVAGGRPMHDDPLDALLAGTWRPALSITGAAGLPSPTDGGNVLRPMTAAKLSLRLPPTVSSAHAAKRLKETLEAAPPYGVRVRFEAETPGDGWDAPATAPWLPEALARPSGGYFGRAPNSPGTGGSIPFMAMLGARYPQAQFMITGVLGPDSNAHGPNEYLHVPTGVRVTA